MTAEAYTQALINKKEKSQTTIPLDTMLSASRELSDIKYFNNISRELRKKSRKKSSKKKRKGKKGRRG